MNIEVNESKEEFFKTIVAGVIMILFMDRLFAYHQLTSL